jgi:DUF1680 family protein
MYTHTADEIYLGLYGASQTEIPLTGGKVRIRQVSDYPFDGKINLRIEPRADHEFALKLRIPTWAREKFVPGELYRYIDDLKPRWTLAVNGKQVRPKIVRGFATIDRTWRPGDRVDLHLPMPLRYTAARDEVKANHHRLAVTRGPLVYCAEQADNGNERVQRFYIEKRGGPAHVPMRTVQDGLLEGIAVASVPAREVTDDGSRATVMKMIPYYAWNNRGEGSMIIWIPRTRELAAENMVSNLPTETNLGTVSASYTHKDDTVAAVVDGKLPMSSADRTHPRWASLPFENRSPGYLVDLPDDAEGPQCVGLLVPR